MIQRLIPYFKPHWKLFFLDMFFAFMIAAIDLVFPILSRSIVNDFIPNANLAMLVNFSLIGLGLFLLRTYCTYFVGYWGHMMGARMEYDMKAELFEHMQKLHHTYFDKNRTGQIMNRFTGDLFEIAELAHHGPEDLFISLIMLVGSFFILLFVDMYLTLIVFFFVVILVIFSIYRRVALSKAFKEQKAKAADLNAKLENSVSGIRLAKAFTNEDYEKSRFDEYNQALYDSKDESYFQMSLFTAINNLLTDLLNLSVIAFGGYFVYKEWITFGDLVVFLLYTSFMMKPVRRLMDFIQQYQMGMAGFERFLEIIDVDPEIKDAKHAKVLNIHQGKIEFKQVDFRYALTEKHILKDFNLVVNPGETVALVGSSGVGKTTLAHLIPRFYEIESGEILVDGMNIQDVTMKSLRNHIGFVSQDVLIFYGTIEDNIRYGRPEATLDEIIEAAKKANIHEFVMGLENQYDTVVGERGIMLSGGQKQRLSIARLFLKDPSILILDEATSALDNENEAIVQKSIEALAKGRTTVVIAHRLTTIRNADRIVVIDEDGIAEEGDHDSLLESKGAFYKFYTAQYDI